MIKLHKIIRLLHVVAWPVVFVLLYARGWQGGVLKAIKNDHFLVYLVVEGLVPKLSSEFYIRIARTDNSATCSCVPGSV